LTAHLVHLVRDEPEVERRRASRSRAWWFCAGILVGVWIAGLVLLGGRMVLA
jgi:hypothetical protein